MSGRPSFDETALKMEVLILPGRQTKMTYGRVRKRKR